MKNTLKWLLRPVYKKYEDLLLRVSNLETAVDCLIDSPRWVESEETAFNEQKHRKLIFQDLVKAFAFDAIIETGTWLGDTAGYMATVSRLPVYTCELNKRFHALAKMRVQAVSGITFVLGDSRDFLATMSASDVARKRVFIYLDAHWYADLPLREELEIVCNAWKDFVVMIDDFQVPGDDGYGYDSYGKGKALSLDVFRAALLKHGLTPFFPALLSGEETGAKRGCVVLARKGDFSETLDSLQSLCRRDF